MGMMKAQARRLLPLPRVKLGWELYLFAGLALVALGLRVWELGGRTMHYDESLHLHYAWRLAVGEGYSHSPWMHGPFQVNLTALIFKMFSDSDFTARFGYALFGSALVFLPYFLRTYLGRTGAVLTAIMLALSPSLLYMSRFGRNEILMAFFAVALLTLMWRYLNEGKDRYLYMASAVLALTFASKETSYIVVAIFAGTLFLLSLAELIPLVLGRIRLSEMRGAPAFLILLVTMSLPQWSALASIPLGGLGLELESVGVGETGLPVLGPPFVMFPLVGLPAAANWVITAAIVAIPLAAVVFTERGRRWKRWLLPVAPLAALTYAFVALPEGSVPRGYLLAFVVLSATFIASAIIGLMWRWKVWLICAGIFYLIWTMLYTSIFGAFVQNHGYCPNDLGGTFDTLCGRFGGVFTGSWQGLGYWLAQQDVARGQQPSYYHLMTLSIYEFLPLLFGAAAVVYYLRKGDLFGQVLSIWAVLTFLAYTISAEKMPWLVVNMAVPLILLAGKFIGDIIERIRWRRVLRTPSSALLLLSPLVLLAGAYLLNSSLNRGGIDSWQEWGLLGAMVAIVAASAYLVKLARPRVGVALAGLGAAALMLGFSTYVSFQASYKYDDSRLEMLVYAQGSADIGDMVDILDSGVIDPGERQRVVDVDYDMWYPFNWYVRQEQKDGTLTFQRYKIENDEGRQECNPLDDPPSTLVFFVEGFCANQYSSTLGDYDKSGPFRNLIWFPEDYKRPGADRGPGGESLPEQFKEDLVFVVEQVFSKGFWESSVDYFLFRRLGNAWGPPAFYVYTSSDTPS